MSTNPTQRGSSPGEGPPHRPHLVVVGLGPGDPELIGVGAQRLLDASHRRFVRTHRHPSAAGLEAEGFDHLYEEAASIDEVYPAIVEVLVVAARQAEAMSAAGPVVYAVPGSPLVAERTVELLRADGRLEVEIVPALSFVDLAWERLGVDPFTAGARLVDGHRFAVEAAGATGPLLVSQCESKSVLSDIKLAVDVGPDVVVCSRLGLADEQVTTVPWSELDRTVKPDHLTCLWVPGLAAPVGAELIGLEELVRILRVACPWDRRQTHASLGRHLIEEAYEVVEAIDEMATEPGQAHAHLEEELGDLLLQVVFHSVIAAGEGAFTLADVARGIHHKLVRRHPHIFEVGSVRAGPAGPGGHEQGPADVVAGWEHAKKVEKGRASIMDGIPRALPALLTAAKVGERAASVSFDWPDVEGAEDKVIEELDELRAAVAASGVAAGSMVTDEVGDLLFSVVNVARHLGVDPEAALREATAKFRGRFAAMEEAAGDAGVDLTRLDAAGWDRLWVAVKAAAEVHMRDR